MDFIRECLDERGDALMDELVVAGFSEDQAASFLPEAVSAILTSAHNPSPAQWIRCLLENPAHLHSVVNVDEIAQKTGVPGDQVTSGFDAITPIFLEYFALSNKGVVHSVVSLLVSGGYR